MLRGGLACGKLAESGNLLLLARVSSMFSVKPGRGPSLGGAIGGVLVAAFGVFWIFFALSAGAPPIFAGSGVIFILMALGGAAYNAYNATAKNRMSSFDITTDREESDPIADALGHSRASRSTSDTSETERTAGSRQYPGGFCPFCGQAVQPHFDHCPACGRDI